MTKFSDILAEIRGDGVSVELIEKLLMIKQGAKYGQIVFMSGGAGSGKGFAQKQFMEYEKFKVRDVDELKLAVLALNKAKGLFPELSGFDLKNPEHVFKLHMFVKQKGFDDKRLNLLLSDLKADRRPNIIYDITGKHISDFYEYIPALLDAGYSPNDLHLVWVMTDYKLAYKQNLTRSRVVPGDIFLKTHIGAGSTMQELLTKRKMPHGMNGSFNIILNNQSNTKFYEVGDTYNGKVIGNMPVDKKGKPMKIVKDFMYINVKREGKPFRDPKEWQEDLFAEIKRNTPQGEFDKLLGGLSEIEKEVRGSNKK